MFILLREKGDDKGEQEGLTGKETNQVPAALYALLPAVCPVTATLDPIAY